MEARTHIIHASTAGVLIGIGYEYQPAIDYVDDFWLIGSLLGWGVSYMINIQALLAGALAPDKLDEWVYDKEGTDLWLEQRRKWTHAWSVFIPLTIASALYFGPNFITLFLVAYSLHCVADSFTKVGAPILDPAERVSLMPVLEQTYQERRITLLSKVVLGAVIYYKLGGPPLHTLLL